MAPGAGRLASRALRGGLGFLTGLGVVVALGGGASIGAAVAAHRTDHAYGDYVDDAEVADVVVNPSLRTRAMDEAIRGFDGVESVRVDSLLLGSVSVTKPTAFADAPDADAWLQTRGSVDGRYIDVDRPAVSSGRVPSGEREVFVSDEYRAELERIEGRGLEVGDTIKVAFIWAAQLDQEDFDPNEVIYPLGVEELRISGFGVLPDEVLPVELYPRQRLILSPDVTARYYCAPPDIDAGMSLEEAYAAFFPEDCATQYDYYSLRVAGGAAGVRSVREQFEAAATELNEQLPPGVRDFTQYFYISQERRDLDDAVRETTRPTVTALLALSVIAMLATVTIVGLMVTRQQRRIEDVQRQLRAVGATRAQLSAWSVTPLLVATSVGVAGAVIVAFAVSPLGPLGTIRSVDPSPAPSLPAAVALPGTLALAAALAIVVGAVVARSAWRAARPLTETRARTGRIRTALARGGPSVTTGVGAATDNRRAGAGLAAMLGCAVATAVAAAAIVFGASLTHLVDDPEAYGWPWDITVITGAGYGDTVPDVVEERLAQDDVRDDIADYGYFSMEPSTLLDGQPVPVVFGYARATDASFPMLEGEPARVAGEAVLGADTADELDVGVGDTVTLEALEGGTQEVQVVGIAVLPDLGAFESDRAGLGTGAFVLVDVDPGAESSASVTGISVRDGADPAAVLATLEPDLSTWSQLAETPVTHVDPVRSAEIINASELRLAPLLLGGLLLVSLGVGLWLAITLSVRDRQRELAILRALGFGSREVRRSVRWQGLTLVAVGLAFGLPLGVIGGRYAWRTFAERLGVVPDTTVPVSWMLGLVVVTLALGWIAVALPARSAARVSPAEELVAS